MNDYTKKIKANEEEYERLKLSLRAYQSQLRYGVKLIRFYLIMYICLWMLVDIIFGSILFMNITIGKSLIIFAFFQFGGFIFYFIFIKAYISVREKVNNRIQLFFDTEPIYGMYYDYWREIKKKTEINLNLSRMVINNISGFSKMLRVKSFASADGVDFNEELLNVNSLVFFNDNWKITYYAINRHSLFSAYLYPLIKGKVRIANKPVNKMWIDRGTQQNYIKKFKEAKLRKFESASFINFKFPNRKKWSTVKNKFSRSDLEYLSSRGIYVCVGNNDINFCFLESTKMPITPGLSIFIKSKKIIKNNLMNDDLIERAIDAIYDKVIFDIQTFIIKYLLVTWFVQKYWGEEDEENLYVIKALKEELDIEF
ncbi:hypothetical protein [Spiroplasma endosymbiont of Aspidapion aeneum]|uniref:hypothetical protein n=1 Tax=Spiroplasma endosymbiont of Aspidapion aeneum TaxID=3066276 RepID=UPI00313B11E6